MISEADHYFHLVYISQASDVLSYKDIENILLASKKNNKLNQVTGLLIHKDGFFVQMLEGPNQSIVKSTLARILQDERHNTLRVICEWTSTSRLFKDWQMGFVDSDLHENNTHFDFIQKLFSDVMLASLPNQTNFTNFFTGFLNSGIELK